MDDDLAEWEAKLVEAKAKLDAASKAYQEFLNARNEHEAILSIVSGLRRLHGEPKEHNIMPGMAAILEMFKTNPGIHSATHIANLLEEEGHLKPVGTLSRSSVRTYISRLVANGHLEKVGTHYRGVA